MKKKIFECFAPKTIDKLVSQAYYDLTVNGANYSK